MKGWGLRVLFADAFGDGFEFLGHGPHVVVVAARYHCGALDVTVYQDLRCQQVQPTLELAV